MLGEIDLVETVRAGIGCEIARKAQGSCRSEDRWRRGLPGEQVHGKMGRNRRAQYHSYVGARPCEIADAPKHQDGVAALAGDWPTEVTRIENTLNQVSGSTFSRIMKVGR